MALGKALEVNSSLQTLKYVVVGVKMRVVVVAMFVRCGCVIMCACSLWNNSIGDGGAVALGKALEVNSSLQTLEYVVGELLLCN